MKIKVPTHTSVVLAYLRATDDFLTLRMINAGLDRSNINQISAALFHLRTARAADVIIDPDGVGWWYALPPEEDSRSRKVMERTPEAAPRRRRRRKSTEGERT